MELLLGADPESFLRNKKTGQYVAAHGLLPGDKKNPLKVEKGAVQVDGLAFEYNIDPASTAEEFSKNHEVVQAQMKEMVQKVDKDLEIVFVPYVQFDMNYFKGLPEEAKILGCDPDYCSSNGSVMEVSAALANSPIRTAAGHIHVGWTKDEDPTGSVHFEDCRFIAHHFYGRTAYIPGVPRTNEENWRLGYYGHSGAFRPKSYGVELRQYSNIWVRDQKSRETAFRFIHSEVSKLGA